MKEAQVARLDAFTAWVRSLFTTHAAVIFAAEGADEVKLNLTGRWIEFHPASDAINQWFINLGEVEDSRDRAAAQRADSTLCCVLLAVV